MRRHGVKPVLDFLAVNLRRRGALDAIRLGLADRRQRIASVEADLQTSNERRTTPPTPDAPPDLDENYTLSEAAWASWRPWVGLDTSDPDAVSERFADARLAFVIHGARADPDAAMRTRKTIGKLGGEVLAENQTGPIGGVDFVVFLSAGDEPAIALPREIGRAARRGRTEVVSFDLFRRESGRVQPMLFPGANPTLLGVTDYVFSRVAVRPNLLSPAARFSEADARTLILDWLKRVTPAEARGRWRHIGRPLVEAAIDQAAIDQRRDEALEAGRSPLGPMVEPVTTVICTRDRGHLTRQLVRALLAAPRGQVAEVVIVANGTRNAYALRTLADLAGDDRVQVIWRDEPFNFSRLANAGVRASRGAGPLLFLNDDVAPVSEDWLTRLAHRLSETAVGAVGPLLLYPDERVQHAGMYLGHNGRAAHVLRGARLPEMDYLLTGVAAREVSCLTGAVLLVRREAFEALGGFDDQLATHLQDVDFGLRLTRSGWANVFEPAAVLLHMESTSIRPLESRLAFHRQRDLEYGRFVERWGMATLVTDPYHPPGFDIESDDLRRLSGARGARPAMRNGLPEHPP